MSVIGKTLGTFECTALLGKGGMGEVYKAKDQKLGRDVAIKVLPEEFAKDADRVARFQREAKLLASLNHPNIASIYGLEESEGAHFLVLELVEGDTLADRLKHGAIPVEESLKLALQIAEALEAAHEKGVIHRDLKPANIKVTPDGKVKVLDFGLAKAFAGEQAEVNLSHSPTLSEAATLQGVILGTAAYMSPEQARGKPVDKRADVWAFGCVLYEMLTGKAAFSGRDVTDILAAVIRADPEWKSLPENLHWRLREVLERCLEKEAKDRYSGINDARVDIQRVIADPSGVFAQSASSEEPLRRMRLGLPWIAAIVLLGIIITSLAIWNLKPTEPLQLSRSYHDLPMNEQFGVHTSPFVAVSPDGRKFVYSTTGGIYLRSLDELDARHISGSDDDAVDMFFSPDGNWIGYWSENDGQMKKIAISGGAPITITDATITGGPIWYEDDTIVYAQQGEGFLRISANGGDTETIIKADNEILIRPQLLPGGKSVLFTNVTSSPYKVMVQSLKSGERKELFEGDSAQYVPTGHLIYALENNLMAVPFNVERLETVGGSIPIVEGVFRQIAPQYAVSESGTLVYVPGMVDAESQRTLVWVDRDGKEEQLSAEANSYGTLKISPDGAKAALTIGPIGNSDIWIWDVVRETMTRLTFDEAVESDPLWTPDNQRVAFYSAREKAGVYWKAADGTGETENLCSPESGRSIYPLSWGEEGKILILEEVFASSGDIGMFSMEDGQESTALLRTEHSEIYPQVSPDGQWIAYQSNESGRMEVYVRSFPEMKGKWQISTSGGEGPRWSPQGKELFYRANDAVVAVPVETEPTFKPGKPEVLFRGTYAYGAAYRYPIWDIHPNGKRFLMVKPPVRADDQSTPENPRKINIVLNWFEELKERVPMD